MQRQLIRGCLSGLVASLCLSPAFAHGGQYTGPKDVVPPGAGGGRAPSGPTTGGRGGPTTPPPGMPAAPGSPTTGGGSPTGGPPGPAARGAATTGGPTMADDLTRWDIWWEINKAQYLHLKDAIHAQDPLSGDASFWLGATRRAEDRQVLAPTEKDIQIDVLPALQQALTGSEQRDIVSSCMAAMAKAGHRPGFRLEQLFLPRVRVGDQEVRETAALALGIAGPGGHDDAFAGLVALATDSADGRKLAARAEVDLRTRTFATYGLGLFAKATSDPICKQRALTTLQGLMRDPAAATRDLRVATILSLGLLGPDTITPAGLAIQREAVDALRTCWLEDLGPSWHLVQAHCATSLQRLIPRTDPLAEGLRDQLARDLDGKLRKQTTHDLARSAVLALGELALPCDDARSAGAANVALLLRTLREHKDAQTRAFAAIALGRTPGAHARGVLLAQLEDAPAHKVSWLALGLGVHEFHRRADCRATNTVFAPHRELGDVLLRKLREHRSPEVQGACTIALGLSQHLPAAPALQQLLADSLAKEDVAGHVCIALALMGDTTAKEPIQQLLGLSVRRPTLLAHAAMALGRLGDKSVADRLLGMLRASDSNLARMSAIARALGHIGDRRTIRPMVELLHDNSLTDLSRAFAAVGLGGIADQRLLPWNSGIGCGLNYRAATATLIDGATGILDIQ